MSKKHFYSLWLLLIGIFFGHTNTYAQQLLSNLVLVSSTDFSAEGAEELEFTSASSINDFGGICPSEITIGEEFKLTPDTKSSTSESTFLSGMYYGISYNSRQLDSLRMGDEKGDWGIVFSSGNKMINTNTLLLNYRVRGLKNGGKYRVVVEYCNPLGKDYLDNQSKLNKTSYVNGGPYMQAYNTGIKVGTNNKGADGYDPTVRLGQKEGCETMTINFSANTDNRGNAISSESLDVNIYMSQSGAYSAIKIKSIKVYSEIDPIIMGKTSDCMGGKNVPFKLSDSYSNCTYQWFKDNNPIAGATKTTYTHTTGNTEGEHVFYCEIKTPDGTKIKSQPLYFTDKVCCVDGDGNPADEKLIWQDDFGTFTEEGHYWVWDYSDINNPVKVEKTTPDGWTYELPYLIPGAEYQSVVYEEGTYAVAANVTSSFDKAKTGTMWEWQAFTFYGATSPKSYGKEYAPDHTSSMENAPEGYGAMLFLNCGNEPDEVLYERTIMGLCNKSMTAKCHISTWAASDYPVKIKIRVTDLNSGESYTSKTVERKSSHEDVFIYNVQTAWDEVSVKFDLTGDNPSLKLEIISEAGGLMNNKEGNDLILDDIQIWECSVPNVTLSFENNEIINDTITCSGDDITLFTEQTTMIENYYRDDAAYIYQYTFENPLDNKSWKAVPGSDVTKDTEIKNLDKIFNANDLNDKVYFRVVLGLKETLKSLGLDYPYNPNDVCAAYSVSNTIVATINCPSCTKPKDIKIKADKEVSSEKKNDKDIIDLCFGESVTLSQAADITPDESEWGTEFEGFAIKWFESESTVDMNNAELVLNGTISNKVITFKDSTLAGTIMPVSLHAVDAIYPDGNCMTNDIIYIRFNSIVDAEFITSKVEFNEGKGKGEVDLTLTNGTSEDFLINWWLDKTKIETSFDVEFFENMKSENSGIYTYQLTNKETGCVGDLHNFDVKISPATEVKAISIDDNDEIINVYTISGALVKSNVKRSEALNGLANGTYLVGSQKVVVNK